METGFIERKVWVTLILIFIIFVAAVGYFLIIGHKQKSLAFCAYQPSGRQCSMTGAEGCP
jgi:hypothetical protein